MLPTWWYPQGLVLPELRGGAAAGKSQAALRVLLALVAAPRPAGSFSGEASISDLQDWTQLSRPMVLKGIAEARLAGLIAFEPGMQGRKSTYRLVRADESSAGGWAKAPNQEIRQRVPRLPHRGDVALAALKFYLTLLAARPNQNLAVALKHETLRTKSGCQTRHVRSAISLLAIEGLVQVRDSEEDNPHRVQRYALSGRLEAPRRWTTEDRGEVPRWLGDMPVVEG